MTDIDTPTTPRFDTRAPDAEWQTRWRSASNNPLAWRPGDFAPTGGPFDYQDPADLARFRQSLDDAIAPSQALHARLLEFGGWAACMIDPLESAALLAHGSLRDGAGAVLRLGAPCACHDNVETLVDADPALAGWTGYALSDDGMWRYHSWAVKPDGGIVETTVLRAAYFGTPWPR